MDIEESNRQALQAIERRCHAARITPRKLCEQAGMGYSTYWRGTKQPGKISVESLGKMERRLTEIESGAA